MAARLSWESLPATPFVRSHAQTARGAQAFLAGGDDYELCFTAPPRRRSAVVAAAAKARTPVALVGTIVRRERGSRSCRCSTRSASRSRWSAKGTTISAERTPRPPAAFVLRHPAHFIAFGGGAGLAPFAPGTFGTLLALPIFWLAAPRLEPVLYLAALAVLFAIGVWACGVTGRALGAPDAGSWCGTRPSRFCWCFSSRPRASTGRFSRSSFSLLRYR